MQDVVPASDTIVAIATPPGVGGVGVVRVSGPLVVAIAQAMVKKSCATPNRAIYSEFIAAHGEVLDSGIAIFFQGPNSFTGEDVLEIQGHGGPMILNILVKRVLELGARLAEPGEFSKRAFLAKKIDLVQAESIAALIHAQSEQAAIAASKSLQGEFSRRINLILDDLITLRMHIEALIDFPEDDIDDLAITKIDQQNTELTAKIAEILQLAMHGQLINEGVKAVIIGEPNVGKSSLLNFLSGEDKAIVTDIPGTTRDLVVHKVNLQGLLIEFVDTAGIRATVDKVEQLGIEKAIAAVANADLIIVMREYTSSQELLAKAAHSQSLDWLPSGIAASIAQQIADKKIIVFVNKIDLVAARGVTAANIYHPKLDVILGSITEKLGVELLVNSIKAQAGFVEQEPLFVAHQRHIVALQQVHASLEQAGRIMQHHRENWDLLAEELRLAQQHLANITGSFTNEQLLDQIFAKFCIGK